MSSPAPRLSGQMQLNVIGVGLLALLGFSAWKLAHPFTVWSIFPLVLIGYAAFRVAYELTLNRKNVPTLATSFVGRGKIAKILKQEVEKRGDKRYTIIDLGSGRGELTRRIACEAPKAKVIGIEMARIPYWQSSFVQRWLGPDNLSYQCLDFWPYDCSDVDAVVFYLSGTFARRVGEKLYREMKPGSMVISHTFPLIGDWTLVDEINFRSPFKEQIFVYRK